MRGPEPAPGELTAVQGPSGELSDAEIEVFLIGEGIEGIASGFGSGRPKGSGHWCGPSFGTVVDLEVFMVDELLDAIAQAEWVGDEWRVWFPDDSP